MRFEVRPKQGPQINRFFEVIRECLGHLNYQVHITYQVVCFTANGVLAFMVSDEIDGY